MSDTPTANELGAQLDQHKYVLLDSEDWSGLYIDGKLDKAADSYLIDARIRELLGVFTCYELHPEDWLPDNISGVQKLEDVLINYAGRRARVDAAAVKRAEAMRLLAEAEELEKH